MPGQARVSINATDSSTASAVVDILEPTQTLTRRRTTQTTLSSLITHAQVRPEGKPALSSTARASLLLTSTTAATFYGLPEVMALMSGLDTAEEKGEHVLGIPVTEDNLIYMKIFGGIAYGSLLFAVYFNASNLIAKHHELKETIEGMPQNRQRWALRFSVLLSVITAITEVIVCYYNIAIANQTEKDTAYTLTAFYLLSLILVEIPSVVNEIFGLFKNPKPECNVVKPFTSIAALMFACYSTTENYSSLRAVGIPDWLAWPLAIIRGISAGIFSNSLFSQLTINVSNNPGWTDAICGSRIVSVMVETTKTALMIAPTLMLGLMLGVFAREESITPTQQEFNLPHQAGDFLYTCFIVTTTAVLTNAVQSIRQDFRDWWYKKPAAETAGTYAALPASSDPPPLLAITMDSDATSSYQGDQKSPITSKPETPKKALVKSASTPLLGRPASTVPNNLFVTYPVARTPHHPMPSIILASS